MKITILGCGGSGGVPLVSHGWGDCNPDNPYNRRRRVSILVQAGGSNILIDTSPDLRLQLLDAGISHIDAVLYTHDHADHVHGIDDLRFAIHSTGQPIPAYGTAETLDIIRARFPYIFDGDQGQGLKGLYPAILNTRMVSGAFSLPLINGSSLPVIAFDQDHGFGNRSTGYRLDRFAYSTDVTSLSDEALDQLSGLDLWVVDCLRWDPHPTHAHFDKAIAWIDQVKPRRAVLTHMNTSLDYDKVKARCPTNVEPAYDGMTWTLPLEAG